jgi:hypothetical protein
LGYFCLQLPAMQSAPNEPVTSREAQLGDTRYFRRFNPFALGSDADGVPSWNNLLADLSELIERIQPQVIVLPHPTFDPHPDHLCSQQAVMQALSGLAWQPETLLHYANHLHDNDRWPMGDAGTWRGLASANQRAGAATPVVRLACRLQMQWRKAMALGMMHDLQPRMPFKRLLRRGIQRCLAARRWPAFGENEFFRKTVRRHELFWDPRAGWQERDQLKVLFLVQKEQRAILDRLYDGIAEQCDCDKRELTSAEQDDLRGYFRKHVDVTLYDRIVFFLRFKKEIRQVGFIQTLPNLVILEHDAYQNYIPCKYTGKFSAHYRKLPWVRVISSGYRVSQRLRDEGFDAHFVPKGYDQALLQNRQRERDIELGFRRQHSTAWPMPGARPCSSRWQKSKTC